ncbi:MAG: TIGR00730 family Rossman fold protein [Rhizomicrobium sp.]
MDKQRPKICVFCASSHGVDPVYTGAAKRFGTLLGEDGYDLVFGGGYVGLMGEVAHAAKLAGANVTGILPEFLRHLEPPSVEEKVIFTEGLPERKKLMMTMADAFAVLPGGIGTVDEFFEVMIATQLRVIAKPIVLLNTDDYYAPLQMLLDQSVSQGFAGASISTFFHVAMTPEAAIECLGEHLSRLAGAGA